MACAVNFPDILTIQGKYQHKPELPFTPGGESAGVISKVGSRVSTFKEGDSVCFGTRVGGFTEGRNLSAAAVRPMPSYMSFAQAASYSTAYQTAWVGLTHRGSLKPNEWLLVHGATGGVGLAAVELGKHIGANVIATGGTDEKLAVVKERGADHVINYTMSDGRLGGFRQTVKDITGIGGADVIYDPVGGDVFDESMRCVSWNGRILTVGFTSGRWPQAAVNLILIKHISVIGVRAGEIGVRDPAVGAQIRNEMQELLDNKRIHPYVCNAFPLENAVEAMRLLIDRKVVGKCVVTMNDYSFEPSKVLAEP